MVRHRQKHGWGAAVTSGVKAVGNKLYDVGSKAVKGANDLYKKGKVLSDFSKRAINYGLGSKVHSGATNREAANIGFRAGIGKHKSGGSVAMHSAINKIR